MKNYDAITGNPERGLDMRMIINLSQVSSFNKNKGKDFMGRLGNFQNYINTATRNELLLYNRVMLTGPSTDVLAKDDNQNIHYGVNYASADYLGLAQHPQAKKAAIQALEKYGIASGSSPTSLGSHEYLFFKIDCIVNFKNNWKSTGKCRCLSSQLDG